MPVGPGGKALNSSYNTRNSPEYKQDLGLAIARFSDIVPDGLLVFFPSYTVLETCIDYWKRTEHKSRLGFSTMWDTINHRKQAVVEPRVGLPSSKSLTK
jgi:regulator of telomere elongation helicase 1